MWSSAHYRRYCTDNCHLHLQVILSLERLLTWRSSPNLNLQDQKDATKASVGLDFTPKLLHLPTNENIVLPSLYLDGLGVHRNNVSSTLAPRDVRNPPIRKRNEKYQFKQVASFSKTTSVSAGFWSRWGLNTVCQEPRHCGVEQSTSPYPCLQKCPKCSQ